MHSPLNVKFVRVKDNQYCGKDDKKKKCHEHLARKSAYQTPQQPVTWKLDSWEDGMTTESVLVWMEQVWTLTEKRAREKEEKVTMMKMQTSRQVWNNLPPDHVRLIVAVILRLHTKWQGRKPHNIVKEYDYSTEFTVSHTMTRCKLVDRHWRWFAGVVSPLLPPRQWYPSTKPHDITTQSTVS
jgi:hypothetical protein